MSRIIGLDIGEKRIGVAISDETQTLAKSLKTIDADNKKNIIKELLYIVEAYGVKRIIAGLPLNMDGSQGKAAAGVNILVDTLRKELPVDILTFDERLTSKQGEAILLNAGISRRKRKVVIDRLAAQIMLQAYLDYNKTKQKTEGR